MKRSVLLALVAALALAIGFSSSASAGIDGSAEISAKKGSKCKAKKGKGKAKGSATASGKGKKGKGKSCKAKGKGKKPPKAVPTPATPSWPPADGDYEDTASSVGLSLSSGATQATISFAGGRNTCVPLLVKTQPTATTVGASTLTASGEASTGASFLKFVMKARIVVNADLSYEAVIDSSLEATEQDPCNKPGVVFKGTLTKAVAPSSY